MTTIPLRNAPLTPVRLLEFLCAAQPRTFRLLPPKRFLDHHDAVYFARDLECDCGPEWVRAGAYISEPFVAGPAQLLEDQGIGALQDAVSRLCWMNDWLLTVVVKPGPITDCSLAVVVIPETHERATATADHPALAALLAYAQLVTGLRLPERERG